MAGTMSQADLVADLKASLQDAASVFEAANDGDFRRHLDVAALALGEKHPVVKMAEITLAADVDTYAVAGDCARYLWHTWGASSRLRPWEPGYTGAKPRVHEVNVGGVSKLLLEPTPTAAQIAAFGATFAYRYAARHVIAADAAQTTVGASSRALLILRAQAEACRELAMRGMKKPTQLRDGLTGAPRNSTPSALFQALLEEFERAA